MYCDILRIWWRNKCKMLWHIKRIFFSGCIPWQSLCSVFKSEVERLICVLCDAVVCVRSSCLMFMYWDASCRSHVAFLMNCFRRLSTFFYSVSLCLSFCLPLIPAPPKNSGTDESGCEKLRVWERRLRATPFALLITVRFCVNSTCLISVWQGDTLNRGALCCNDHFWMQINVFLWFKLKMCHCFGRVFFYAEFGSAAQACGWMW